MEKKNYTKNTEKATDFLVDFLKSLSKVLLWTVGIIVIVFLVLFGTCLFLFRGIGGI